VNKGEDKTEPFCIHLSKC